MEVEKRKSKGGFLQLFDWNGKSLKKLFSNNFELPDWSKQGKENVGNSAKLQPQMMKVDENGASSSNKGSGDYNCASSVTSDEGYGTKAPGVVARLMGLDSLPTSNVLEPYSTPFFDSSSLRVSLSDRSNPNLQGGYHPMEYISMPNKLDKCSQNPLELRLHKVQNRPIEKFQTEMLPPKSAKSIPITHHKLLSPIRSPGFIPTKNVAYIVEAAAKIIEGSPRATTKGKVPSIGSTSVPMRIRDLKEKMDAAHKAARPQRPNKPSASKYTKVQSSNKDHSVSENIPEFRASVNPDECSSDCLKDKGKSVSLAVQAKVNVQRREGPTSSSCSSSSSSSRSFVNEKEQNEVKSNQFLKSQPSMQRPAQKRITANRSNNVLRQNNQKQNSVSNKDRSSSKSSVAYQQARKAQSMSDSIGPNKTIGKVVVNSETGSRKMGSVATNTDKELQSSKTKNFSRKKQFVNGNVQCEESVANHVVINKHERSIKCNVSIDGSMNWGEDNRKKGMDVVSFTFMSPIVRSMPQSQSSVQVMVKNNVTVDSFGENDLAYSENIALSSPGLNVIGGDALSLLLEQKLRELTYRVESSHCNLARAGTSASSARSLQDSKPTLNLESTASREQDKMLQLGMLSDKSGSRYDDDCSSIDDLFNVNQQRQGLEEMENHSTSSNNSETGKELGCLHPHLVSILEPFFASGGCSDIRNSSNSSSKQCALDQAQEVCSWLPENEALSEEGGIELSESASSMSTGDMERKHIVRTFSFMDFKGSDEGELEYVRDILGNAELMLEDFALGQAPMLISPNPFDQLENQESGMERNEEGCSELGRKVLYDCVSECLDLRCGQLFVGSCKAWDKLVTLFQRKGCLAEELYKEILGWKSMGELMMDQLVDKDMGTQYGRWIDFDMEAFEKGVEIEKGILTSLVDEVVSDLLLF